MPTLIDLLNQFNRKERFFLIGAALGNPTFQPDPPFLAAVGEAAQVNFPDPEHVHCYMDFHLDWLYAALLLSSPTPGTVPYPSPAFASGDAAVPSWNVNTNQEDIDLLLAYEDGKTTYLVLVEAKGATGWTTRQVLSKGRRLKHIFGEDGLRVAGVAPHFVLTSPDEPLPLEAKLKKSTEKLPGWMRTRTGSLAWFKLAMPTDSRKLHRCDQSGNHSKSGAFWYVDPPLDA